MIDPNDPLEVQLNKQQKIIDALMRRAERSVTLDDSAYSLFNSAIALQGEVWAKEKDLEQALHTLGKASDELRSVRTEQEETQATLADAIDTMESGLAIFAQGKLRICNGLFRTLLPDVGRSIRPDMSIETYFRCLRQSRFVEDVGKPGNPYGDLENEQPDAAKDGSFVLPIEGDRWFQITWRNTDAGNTVVLQTEVTQIVRRDRAEREKMQDDQTALILSAFDYMDLGVCTLTEEGRIIRVNGNFRNILSLPLSLSAEGTDLHQLLHHWQSDHALQAMDGPFDYEAWSAQLLGPAKGDWQVRHRSGRILAMKMHPMPGGGRILSARDITDELQTREDLEQRVASRTQELTTRMEELEATRAALQVAKDQAEGAVRSKTRFLAAAGHDLLQPVNAAKLYLSTLTDASKGTHLTSLIERLGNSFNSIEWLLQSILELSRLESTGDDFSVTKFPLQSVFDAIDSDTSALAESKGLDLRIVDTSIWVKSDQRYLTRSVQNLVVNAIQYTPKGRVLVGARARDGQVSIEVHDSGLGIDAADQKRIFEAFTRLDTEGNAAGMGLGLSIVDHACRHLGHSVGLHSVKDHGSAFAITLSQADRAPAPVVTPAPRDFREDLSAIVVLVENDAEVLSAMSERLEHWGASVLAATSTEAAVKLVEDLAIAPDIVIVDYNLDGDDNGIRAIEEVRAKIGLKLPAVMITAHREQELDRLARQNEFLILSKPVPLNRLRAIVKESTPTIHMDQSVG